MRILPVAGLRIDCLLQSAGSLVDKRYRLAPGRKGLDCFYSDAVRGRNGPPPRGGFAALSGHRRVASEALPVHKHSALGQVECPQ